MLMVVMIRRSALPLAFPLVIVALFVTMFFATTQSVSAITNNGLDSTEFDGNARFALENTTDVSGANNVVIPVYYLNSAATAAANSKPPTDMVISINDFGPRTNTSMQVNNGAGWSAARSSNFSFTISKSRFTYRADINGWEATYTARLSGGSGRVQYRADIITPTGSISGRGTIGKIGYDSSNGSKFATANRNRCDAAGQAGCNQYYNYRLSFGTPCTVSANTSVSAYIYDGDNNSTGSITRIQGNRRFTVQVRDVTTGSLVGVTPSGSENNLGTAAYTFTVQPKHKYQFIVNNVYANNVLQFKLPYDSIESLTDCNYNLSPSTSTGPVIAEPASGTLTSTGYVTNNGTAISENVNWQYTRCRVAPGANPAQYAQTADNTSNGVTTYNGLGASCQQVSSGTSKFTRGLNTVTSDSQPMPDIQPGSRICYVMSVNPPTNTSAANVWRHSTPSCTLIGKKPKVHVTGGDLWVGRQFAGATGAVPTSGIQTSLTIKDRTYGSWSEYGAFATGSVVGFGSGSAYAGGAQSLTTCNAASMTFANTANTNPCSAVNAVLGGYKSGQTIPNVAGAFVTNASTPTLSGTQSLTNLNGLYKTSGNLTISGGSIAKGRSVIINAAGATVTIDGNITYDGSPLTSIDQIPQVVIIAGNINIRGASAGGAVSNVDAWLIATGTVNTCYDANLTALTINVCATPLVINGPVMARTLILGRTAGSGSGAASGDPAEVINLRPDAYLWGIYQGSKSGRLETTYERELPPRF